MKDLLLRDLLLTILLVFDIAIIIILVYLYYKFKKILAFPWEEFEQSLEKAQKLVERLRELKSAEERSKELEGAGNIEEKVVQAYREGLSVREISRRVGLSAGEVEIILKRRGIL